mmetsp:Transcript_33435/g.73326  ORF Transcript_33435/g.73326 Transcript_33435/m.73326 type:complete len:93 (+) Transcript_33435:81-359(+)
MIMTFTTSNVANVAATSSRGRDAKASRLPLPWRGRHHDLQTRKLSMLLNSNNDSGGICRSHRAKQASDFDIGEMTGKSKQGTVDCSRVIPVL